MELKIPKEPKKAETYELCQREDISIGEVVKERAGLVEIRKNKNWAPHVLEKFELRMRYLDGRIVEEYLKNES